MIDVIRAWVCRDPWVPIWYDAEYRLPLTAFGKRTGLEPRRADLAAWYLLEWHWTRHQNLRTPSRAGYQDLARVHTEQYLESLSRRDVLARIFGVDPWDVPIDEVMRTVRLACGGTIAAARASLRRRGPAVNLLGGFHHAGPSHGAGLCAVNDIAIAVATLRHEGFTGPVAVLDLDAHPPDGTAACLRSDPAVWIGSLSGASSGQIRGIDDTCLPPGCDDRAYLEALDALIARMPPPALAFVVAGGDVLADDHLGRLGLTLDGARRRDLAVVRALEGVPSVWLPGGGYHTSAWMVLAGTVLALSHRTRRAITPGADPLAVRFARLARRLDRRTDHAAGEISLADVAGELGVGRPPGAPVLLGVYSAEALEYALYRFGLLGFLERRGYGKFRIVLGTASIEGERLSLYGQADDAEHLLIDCVLERRTIRGKDRLYVHWLTLRDPRARFGDRRPRLPGQDVPGLGLAREMNELLLVLARRVDASGVAFSPAWYHTAYVSRGRFRFADPVGQGRFDAMLRDFGDRSLTEVSRAFAQGRILMNGEPCAWDPGIMISEMGDAEGDRALAEAERDHVRFELVPPLAGADAPPPSSQSVTIGPREHAMASDQIRSIAQLFLHRVSATPEREALRYPTGTGWASLSWQEVGARVRAIAAGLRALGLEDEERAAIVCSTRYEWVLVDLGIMCAGCATTTIYPSSTAEECAYILNDSASRVVFVENVEQLAKVAQRRDELPHLLRAVLIEGSAPDDGWTLTLTTLVDRGRERAATAAGSFETVVSRIGPSSLATLIYTSGTTGKPKGVELTHDNWLYEGVAIESLGLVHDGDLQYLWLPLSHSFGKVLQVMQLQIGFATAIDGRVDRLVENLPEVKPTFVAAVPRVFEKVHNKVVLGAHEGSALKRRIFEWAMDVGRRVSKLQLDGRTPAGALAIQHALADRLVFSKLKNRFGGRLRFFISGSAALSKEIAEFFHAAGILIAEGYGLTETSAATFVNRPGHVKFGTVGQPMPGTEVRIARDDGEILLRGRGVMRGYHHLPEATAEAFDEGGWFRTGDIGHVDAENFLTITDRKKDLIKTSGGKYVAPQALESKLKALCPYISQALVHGDKRNFCTALVTIDEENCRKWLGEQGAGASWTREQIAAEPRVRDLVQQSFDRLNATLASYETIKRFALLPHEFSIEAGELTPSQKIKRKVVETKYRAVLDEFYAETLVRA